MRSYPLGGHPLQDHFDAMREAVGRAPRTFGFATPEKAVPFLRALRGLLGETFDINWEGLECHWSRYLPEAESRNELEDSAGKGFL